MSRQGKIWRAAALCLALLMAVMPSMAVQAAPEAGSADGQTQEQAADAQAVPEQAPEIIHIRTVSDYVSVAEQCHYDAWSANKKIVLESDLVLTAQTSVPIAVLAGEFDGQGHEIDGFVPKGSYDRTGLFGEITPEGCVHDLTVGGMVVPDGIQQSLGGVAGINAGRIEHCSFHGTISADARVGGMAAENRSTGIITDCTVSGTIRGNSFTGGLCGYNEGLIENSVNEANANTVYVESAISQDELSHTLENIMMTGRLNETENLTARTDTGGIAGFNAGTVRNCRNEGRIGCEHTGYNVGGIAGRSSGYLVDCINHGTISGRKDIGGIVGQMQPYLQMEFTQDELDRLDAELDSLNGMINSALSSASSYSNALNTQLQGLSDLTSQTRDQVQTLAGTAADDTDAALGTAEADLQILQEGLRQISGASADLGGQVRGFQGAAADFAGQIEGLLQETLLTEEEKQQVREQVPALREGAEQAAAGASALEEAFAAGDALPDPESVRGALTQISGGVSASGQAAAGMLQVLEQHASAHEGEVPSVDTSQLYSSLKSLSGSAADLLGKVQSAGELLGTAKLPVTGVSSEIRSSSDKLYASLQALQSEMSAIEGGLHEESQDAISQVRAISGQVDSVLRTVESAANGQSQQPQIGQNAEDAADQETVLGQQIPYLSDEQLDAAELGCVRRCSGNGTVNADLCGGGIAGTMNTEYDLDPEKDIVSSGSLSVHYSFLSTCAMDACSYEGTLNVKGNYAGGAVGRMEMGVIRDARISGDVLCGEDYAGGIAGYSAAQIRGTACRSRVQGKRYVGGIAGYGNSIHDCTCMADCTGTQYVGAVAGDVRERSAAAVSGNLYYSEDTQLHGIGGISLTGIAEPAEYEALSQAREDDFYEEPELVFITDDGEVLKRIRCAYGASLTADELPAVPEKVGFEGTWSRTDFSRITANDTVTAQYSRIVTLIAGLPVRESGQPVFLAEGFFRDGDVLQVKKLSGEDGKESYEVTLPENGRTNELRFLPEDSKTVRILLEADGVSQQIEPEQSGAYVRFAVPEAETVTVTITPERNLITFLKSLLP